MIKSPNFEFLRAHDPLLLDLAIRAERYCFSDPPASIMRVRQFAENMALSVVAAIGGFPKNIITHDFATAVRVLEQNNIIANEISQILQQLRQLGNRAVHENIGTKGDALHALRLALRAAVWFHRTIRDPAFKSPAFAPPPEPPKSDHELADELKELRERFAQAQARAEDAARNASEQARLRQAAEQQARKAYEDLEAVLDLAGETEQKLNAIQAAQADFTATLAQTPAPGQADISATIEQGQAASAALSDELDESDTRLIIDGQLRAAGWEAGFTRLRYAHGTRPEAHRHRAIAEWPTASGPVDYALFHGKTLVGLIEAKRRRTDIPGVLEQTKRYSRDFRLQDAAEYAPGAPWGDHHAPFLFATNGRPWLRQLQTASGIWFLDTRHKANQPRALDGWYSPEGILAALNSNHALADAQLGREPVDLPGLRYYQCEAIKSVEDRIAAGRRDMLLAMATGTGKTRTCVALLYRLIRARRFHRILFLVDRNELGAQARDVFNDVRMEGLQSFSQFYDVKEIGDARPDESTRVHIATVQGMVKRLLYPSGGQPVFPVDTYDCIIIDECHRGYTLDRDLAEDEIGFLDEKDFISKYRRVLEHFDAVRIGLTATPALHTTEIFGPPVHTYSYRQAVIDGFLVDHEPPVRIVTRLAEDGIRWEAGEQINFLDPATGRVDPATTPDEVLMDVDKFNSEVITENFNRTVCAELARHIDPALPGKTLVFCVNDRHADMVVASLSAALAGRYGVIPQDTVLKITGNSDRPSQLIRRYKNEELPKIGVTVDLLTTGIDVPAITSLVFIRRVKSRILYEQMLGRATRLCPDLFGPGEDKEVFHIYDAVDLYASLRDYTEMRPVAADPGLTLARLVDAFLATSAGSASRQHFHDAILARLQRKKSLLRRHDEHLDFRAGRRADALLDHLRSGGPDATAALFTAQTGLAAFIDSLRRGGSRSVIPVSPHPDELRRVETGYGASERPADYLENFAAWLRENSNTIPALVIVTRRPRDLTRAQLRELALTLDAAGFSETYLRNAWRDARQEDAAATIIGFIRAQAIGSPLVPYEERVRRALKSILHGKRYQWTAPQRKWLERIGRYLLDEVIVDRDTFASGRLRDIGGFAHVDRAFDGRLAGLLGDLQEEIWRDTA